MASSPATARVCVGTITGPHGVRGLIRVKPFTVDPAGITAYGPPTDEAGRRRFELTLMNAHKGQWIARIDGIADRTAAEALAGTRLYVERGRLPEPEEDAYYHADLLGLPARDPMGRPIGRVRALYDFGAGDVIELALDAGGTATLPFSRAAVPEVDLAAGHIVVVLETEDPKAEGTMPGEPAPAHRPAEAVR